MHVSVKLSAAWLIVLCSCQIVHSGVEIITPNDKDYDADHQHRKFHIPESEQENPAVDPAELESDFWREQGQNILKDKLKIKLNTNTAKNIIYFVGDGMSLQTVAATRMYMGNENNQLSFEKFPHFGLSKTYCVNRQVADSACTSTAYLAGVKANYGTIGVNAKVPRYDCLAGLNNETHTIPITQWAQAACKSTGIVTTTRITHATPAGTYANVADRDWESDANVIDQNCDPSETIDIATQLVYNEISKKFKVILGGGRRSFIGKSQKDEEGHKGKRVDERNLINEWLEERSKFGKSEYVWNKGGLQSVDIANTDYLLGLFESDHCRYNLDITNENLQDSEPTLSEMVETALKMLQKDDKNGYLLFVESGRIDTAHHSNSARLALGETEEFSKTVALVKNMTNEEDTLIVVTSDHAHTLTYNGYPLRGSDVLGIAEDSDMDFLPYTTLSYANGKGYENTYTSANLGVRTNISGYDFSILNTRYLATAPLSSETHGGDDVGIYAVGPWSHLFIGNYEQNSIPYLIAYAAKIGHFMEGEFDCSFATSKSVPLVLLTLLASIQILIFN